MQAQENELLFFLNALRRRKWYFIVPSAVTFIIATAVTFLLPAVYQSSATILIENQEVPQDLVRTTVTGFVEERLQSITQVVLNRNNLLEIINKYGLYAELRDSSTTEEILEKMRKDIVMEPVQADVVNSQSGRPTTATIAFKLSYDGKDANKVLQATNTLVSLFLEENLREREKKTQTTYNFIEKQLETLRGEVQGYEERIARFKEEHLHSLPELMELNMQTLDRLQKDIDARQENIKTLIDRKVYLEGQLATVEPVGFVLSGDGRRVMAPEDELKALRSQYISLVSTKSDKHPDVQKLKGQIAMLESELSTRGDMKGVSHELTILRGRLDDLTRRYSDKHPDVLTTRSQIAALESRLQQLDEKQKVLKHEVDLEPDNPAYINLQSQIHATELDLRNEQNLIAELRSKYARSVQQIEETPKVEQEYREMLRGYENSNAKYQETLQKLMAARQARELEGERVGERLTLVEPPVLPEKPYKPKRLLLLLVGLVLSLGVGVGTGAMVEFFDNSFYGREGLASLVSFPVLGVIPYVVTAEELRAKRRRKFAISASAVCVILCGVVAVHTLIMPLDILWLKVVQKLQIVV
ncbi:Wzz/FepE/Etk N-terminal domain-containing protein [Desulfovibrio mangrovi]|uniref:Wzz/FepE/Etk N-terminal domain-containing protein n=1 Tax=Desulfovibrio mangrovi TaxID=2976983 RepID=UPI002246C5F8|nr:Wzz/FepE/Etk N-terminal domain-containing protein [Desulfovibrio mangrovi]UZP67596.1 Wzz/FepE/Etk N-terminal domain-containing protein [Desulfovibrio mangrovi]